MKAGTPKMVLVEWEDSTQPTSSWMWMSDIPDEQKIVKCKTVGWLIEDGKDVKTLALTIGDGDDKDICQANGIINIPTRCTIRTVHLLTSKSKGQKMAINKSSKKKTAPKKRKILKVETSDRISTKASSGLRKPEKQSLKDIRSVSGSALRNDETKGKRSKKR